MTETIIEAMSADMTGTLAGKLFETDRSFLDSEKFHELCQGTNKAAFTRDRKVTHKDITLLTLNRKGLTTHSELRTSMKIIKPGVKISKPGYHKRKMALNAYAIEALYKHNVKNLYSHPDFTPRLFNGHYLLALDGSDIHLPETQETFEHYGLIQSDGDKIISIGFECVSDVLNNIIVDHSFNPPRFNEITAAEKLLDRVRDTVGNKYQIIATMDRRYPSIPFMLHLEKELGLYFVVRLSSKDYKMEQEKLRQSGSNDEYIDLSITPGRKASHQGTQNEKRLEKENHFLARFIRIPLPQGLELDDEQEDEKILITNLPRDEFPYESLEEIYRLRWQVETTFKRMKSHLQLENFSGTRLNIIYQDIFATIYLYNLAEEMIRDVEDSHAEHLQNDYKYPMKVNRNISYGLLKEDLIFIVLEKDRDKRQAMMQTLYDNMLAELVQIKPGRHFKRKTRGLRYSNSYKRSY